MKVQLAPELIEKLKKEDIRLRKHFKKAIDLFSKDHSNPELNNHKLHREWAGFRSIDITADYRAIYQEDNEGDEPMAYFVAFDTHKQLYRL